MKFLSEIFFIPGFIALEYGIYLQSESAALIIGGIIFMSVGLLVAKNGMA